jgi:hypothetical protein
MKDEWGGCFGATRSTSLYSAALTLTDYYLATHLSLALFD